MLKMEEEVVVVGGGGGVGDISTPILYDGD